MTAADTDVLTMDYLKRLEKALAPVPRARRAQLMAEIADHVATARAQLESPTEADIATLLERIGRPEDIAAEAMGEERPVSSSGRWMTRIGLVLLPIAGLLILAELIGGVASAVHYILRSGITARRREWSTAFFIVVGAIGPIITSLVLFDLLKTGMTWKSRLGLVGFLGSVIGGVAVLVFIGFWFL